MYVEWHSAGSAQVVSPAAAWLSDFMLDLALTLLSRLPHFVAGALEALVVLGYCGMHVGALFDGLSSPRGDKQLLIRSSSFCLACRSGEFPAVVSAAGAGISFASR
jgi:hypothetical protein